MMNFVPVSIHIVHYPSRAPLFDLQGVDLSTTLGKLKTVIEECVEAEADLLERVRGQEENGEGGKEIIGQKRLRSSSGAQHHPLSSSAFIPTITNKERRTTFELEPKSYSNEGGCSGSKFFEVTKWYLAELDVTNHINRLVEIPIASCTLDLPISYYTSRFYVSYRIQLFVEIIVAGQPQDAEQRAITANRASQLLEEYSNDPMDAYWETLTDFSFEGPDLALAVVCDPRCGIDRRTPLAMERIGNENKPVEVDPGSTPLIMSVLAGRADVTKALLEIGVNVHASTCDKWTALHVAARINNLSAINLLASKLILSSPASYMFDLEGYTPLHVAICNGLIAAVELLLAHGSDVNACDIEKVGTTPLHLAILINFEAAIRFLLQHGANINARDRYGKSPLRHALTRENKTVFEMLIAHGCTIDPETLIEALVKVQETTEFFEMIIACGIDLDARHIINGRLGDSDILLLYSIRRGFVKAAKLLITAGANLHLADAEGMTALHIAAMYDNAAVVDLLLMHNCSIVAKDCDGNHPLDYALQRHGVPPAQNVAQKLLEQGSDVNHSTKMGYNSNNTPLHRAAAVCGRLAEVKLLLDHGSDVLSVNGLGNTPLDVCEDQHVYQLLRAERSDLILFDTL